MRRTKRTVADRQKSLQPVDPDANFTLAGVRRMYASVGKEFRCTISGHCRTRIFEFPRIDLRPNGDAPHYTIYDSPPLHACVTSNLVGYFENGTRSRHYTISPCLQHEVAETDEKIASQQGDHMPVFVVIEEDSNFTPVRMVKGECSILPEVLLRDGEKVPMLVAGREGREFITAWATVDGAWPQLPNTHQVINLILAAVRVAQQTPDPIRKYVDQSCLVTDDGRFVVMMRPQGSARLQTVTVMDGATYRGRTEEIRKAIWTMELDIATPHMAMLVNSMYSDEYKDDAYQRLQYLRLWQSLVEAGGSCLGYQGNIREDNVVVGGNRTLLQLKEYRDDIAHWWTDAIDENLLADLQRTINQLVYRRYF